MMPPADQEVLIAKLDGMQAVIDSRFTAFEREQDGMIKWMERLTSTLESQVQLTANLFRVEEKIRSADEKIQRHEEAIDELTAEVSNLKSANSNSTTKLAALIGGIVMIVTAATAAFFEKVLS